MIEKILHIEESLCPIQGHVIHDEFSHSKVEMDMDNLIIYDWEKMRTMGAPCWDIAKWIRYFHYFYFVEKARKDPLEIPDDLLQIKDNKLL